MLANRLRHRVEFQEAVTEQDSETGEMLTTWVTALASVPAECLTGAGREAAKEGSKFADSALRVNCRWFAGLSPEWRVIWQNKIYEIMGFETDATDRREYRIFCRDGIEFVGDEVSSS